MSVLVAVKSLETASAGTAADAEVPVTPELLTWADLIVVMQPMHRRRLASRFSSQLAQRRVVCLDIADDYDFMDATLVALLQAKMSRHLPAR